MPRLAHLSYPKRLEKLKLDTLYFRRRRSDLVQVYRIVNDIDSIDKDVFFDFSNSITRGNSRKLIKPRASTSIKLHSFSHRIINDWNSLPDEVVLAKSINSFKALLGKYWLDKDFRLDFKF